MSSLREAAFQHRVVERLRIMLPSAFIFKSSPYAPQGFPDITILYEGKWAALECKRSENEIRQPNQEWYVTRCNEMAFCSFIFPENEEEVIADLLKYLSGSRNKHLLL